MAYPQATNTDDEPNIYNEIDAAPELLVTQFSSEDEDKDEHKEDEDEADEEDIENYL